MFLFNLGEIMYKIICYYNDMMFGQCSYVCKDNLTEQEALKYLKEHEHYDDIYRMEKM